MNRWITLNLLVTCFLLLNIFPLSFALSVWTDLADYEAPEYKRFVIIICSRNNALWVEQNLYSAFIQDYPRDKFRIIYIDDNSSDATPRLVFDFVTECNEWDHVILIRNTTWQSIMANHYKAAYMCDDDEIIVHLDGDDFLKHDKVLFLLNKVYNKWDVWLTYGQYENWPLPELGFSIEVPEHIASNNLFRELGFWYSHLRTFYAWLFKKIALKDLIWRGSFIPTSPTIDYMIMFPLMEMAGHSHYRFISDGLYLYNRSNALSTCNMPIKIEIPPTVTWKKYEPLLQKDGTVTSKRLQQQADLIIYSCDNPWQLKYFIDEEVPKIKDSNQVFVLYHARSNQLLKAYQALLLPSHIIMINLDKSVNETFLASLFNEYCLIITDTSLPIEECSMAECIFELERTQTIAFFLGLSKKSFKACNEKINYGPFADAKIEYRVAPLENGIVAWQCMYEDYVWNDPMLTKAVLLRKKDIENKLPLNEFRVEVFTKYLHALMAGDREMGLFFEQSIFI